MLGKTLGSYEIKAVVGQGGMGTVYRGEHTLIGKRAAIKVLRPEYGHNDELVQRFFNEARAAARIEHSGIIDVYDFGREGDQAYLVMELLAGEPLSARLARGRLDIEFASRLVRQIAGALAAAHEHDITHRDLKPDNIYLVPDTEIESGVRVKLLDFGIAKLTEADGTSSIETRTGSVIGTPVYMAPEQCRGSGDVDHRADLYALGCIFYEMLCGAPPFARKGVGELITAHMMEHPEPIAARVADLPAEIAALVMRLLAKAPDKRLASAREVVRALAGELVLDRPAASCSMAPAAHLDTLLPGEEDSADTTPDEPGPHAEPADVAADDVPATAPTALSADKPLQSTLSAAAAERVDEASPTSVAARKPTWRLAGLAGLLVVGAAGAWIATGGLSRGDEQRGRVALAPLPPAIDAATPLREPAIGLRHLERFRTATGSEASRFMLAGAWTSAARDFAEASGQSAAPPRWSAAEQLCNGHVALISGDRAASLVAMQGAVAVDGEWDLALIGLARALAYNGDFDAALDAARRAERLSPDWWRPVSEMASVHRSAGNFDLAVEEYQRALAMAPEEPMLLSGLALLYHAMHMDAAAAKYGDQALARDGDMLGVRLLLAERALEKADGKIAREHAEHVLAREPRSAAAKLAQADALRLLGNDDDARVAYQAALDLVKELGSEGLPVKRLEQVERAMARKRLPAPRHKKPGGRSHRHRDRTNKPPNALEGLFD